MLKKIRKSVMITFLSLLGILMGYSICYMYTNKQFVTYEDCGKIVSKSADEVSIKHGSQTELYLNVQFNKSGFRSMNVNPTTYFHFKTGDNICFDLNEKEQGLHVFFYMTGCISSVMIGIALTVLFFGWMFGAFE